MYTQWPHNIPNAQKAYYVKVRKTYQIPINIVKRSIPRPSKYTRIRIFGTQIPKHHDSPGTFKLQADHS
jgi:hypothetical protein